VRFKTRKQAERFASETAHQAARGECIAPAQIPRFGELAEDWFGSKAGGEGDPRRAFDAGEEAEVRARFYPPKTKAGLRAVPLPAPLVAALQAWQPGCPQGELDLVFPNSDGGLIRRTNALRYGLWPALKRAGLRRVTMHSLRHSFASALLMSGRPITEVQHLLGHSSPAVTLKVYAHFLPSDQSQGTDALTKVILGPPRDGQGRAAVDGRIGRDPNEPAAQSLDL